MIERLFQSETYYPSQLESDSTVTAIEYRICKLSDGTWWDFTALAFQAAPADPSGALTEDDNGLWIDSTGWAVPDANATYKVLFEITNPAETFFADGPMIIVNDAGRTIESGLTEAHALQAIFSFCSALASGGSTATLKYRDYGDTKDRMTVTVDANGNRSAISYSFD